MGGQSLDAYVFATSEAPVSGRPAGILLFHGGGWSVGEPAWTFEAARRFAASGLVAIPVEYRLSAGDVTPIDALADVCAAFAWARTEADAIGLDPARLAGYGVSAGGHLVTSAATTGCADGTPGPDALLLWSPALDLANDGWFERKLQGRAPVADYSPVETVRATTPPTSIVQGGADTLTPARGAREYCAALAAFDTACELNVYPGLGHLLTRNLEVQERDFDPDPEAVAAGAEAHLAFLRALGFAPSTES